MGRPLSFDALRKKNVERCTTLWHEPTQWKPGDWLMCVTGEVGELAHLLKEVKRGNSVKGKDIANEIADIVIYLDLLAYGMGIDLGEAVISKFNITSAINGSPIKLRNR